MGGETPFRRFTSAQTVFSRRELRQWPLWPIWIIDNYWIDCHVIMSTSLISPDKTQQMRASNKVAQCSCLDNITRNKTGKSFLNLFSMFRSPSPRIITGMVQHKDSLL